MARLINRIHVTNHDDNIVNESDVAEGRIYMNPKTRNRTDLGRLIRNSHYVNVDWGNSITYSSLKITGN